MRTFSSRDVKARTAVVPVSSTTGRLEEFSNTVIPLARAEDYVREIGKLWDEAQRRFLAIGRYLRLAIKANKGEFEAKILPQLPFGRAVAYQLREVAEAVESGRFVETELPRSYSAAYYLTLVPENQLELARSRGLVRPQAARSEIMRFIQELSASDRDQAKRHVLLIKRRGAILRQIASLQQELTEIEAEIDPAVLVAAGDEAS